MLTILIVDDERIERRGICFLLKQRVEEFDILEAPNGKAACEILEKRSVDILFTDVKMPFMDGIELVGKARELNEQIEMVIFSGYGEFEYARQAMKAGVVSYVLKPVDPEEFHSTMDRLLKTIGNRRKQERKNIENQNFLNQYFLGKYIYQGNSDFLKRISDKVDISDWNQIQGLILIESVNNFFEKWEREFIERLLEEVKQKLLFLNLGQNQELCVLYSRCDQFVLAQHITEWMNKSFEGEFYVAAGHPIRKLDEIPGVFRELELLMGNKFYQKDRHLFLPGKTLEESNTEQFLDDILNRMIENIQLEDILHLWENFRILQSSVGDLRRYSQIYTKFMFANLVKEFFSHRHGEGVEQAVQQIYGFQSIQEVMKFLKSLIVDMEHHLEDKGSVSRNEVARAKSYIYEHYSEDISVETLADLVYLSPGYFSYIFKKEIGENVSRFIREYRMEKAKELLSGTNKKIIHICKEIGFSNVSYFCKSFREYCGCSPEQYRKGEIPSEET
jgi:Response regulator containing CheY-like receiver domain and AraC-type DNA-binding domain